jgi:hypothetical protein
MIAVWTCKACRRCGIALDGIRFPYKLGVSGVSSLSRCFRGPIGTSRVSQPSAAMSALRLVSSVARRGPGSFVLGRRGYAEISDKIKLSLVLPHQVRLHISQPGR